MSFKAVIQKNRRIHIPVVVRWWFKLELGEVFKVHLKLGHRFEDFFGRMGTDGRLTVPKVTGKEFLKSEEKSRRLHRGGNVISRCGGRGRGG